MSIVNSLLKVFLGDKSGKDLKKLTPLVDDINIEFDLALALISEEENTEAINTLLHIIAAEPDWSDGKAKTQIIELLDALGPTNETGRAGRRKLSSLMFS